MLILSRYETQSIVINDDITITILTCQRGQVRIGIDAPQDVNIVREELLDRPSNYSYKQWLKQKKSVDRVI